MRKVCGYSQLGRSRLRVNTSESGNGQTPRNFDLTDHFVVANFVKNFYLEIGPCSQRHFLNNSSTLNLIKFMPLSGSFFLAEDCKIVRYGRGNDTCVLLGPTSPVFSFKFPGVEEEIWTETHSTILAFTSLCYKKGIIFCTSAVCLCQQSSQSPSQTTYSFSAHGVRFLSVPFQLSTMFKPSGKLLTAVITIICSTAFCLFGYDQGVLSGIIGADNQFGKDFDHPDANTQGLIVSVYQLGNVGGSIVIFLFGDHLGRKKSIVWATVIMLIGAVLQTASVNRGMIYAARIITGFGNGANTSTVPVYQAETSTAKQRGQLIAIDSCIIIFGILIAYWMDYGCANISGPAQWRFPVGFQMIFIIIILVLLFFVPETPRFLHAQGKHDEAEEVTARLVGKDVSISDPRVRELSRDIINALELESAGGPFRFKELLQGGKLQNFRRMCISFASNAFQQLGGIVSLPSSNSQLKFSC